MLIIKDENYCVSYDPSTATITCQGMFRMFGTAGYAAIMKLFDEVADRRPPTITLQLHEVQFLNGSGITTLARFIIKLRNKNAGQVIVRGAKRIPWQSHSFKNLKRFMPTLKLEMV